MVDHQHYLVIKYIYAEWSKIFLKLKPYISKQEVVFERSYLRHFLRLVPITRENTEYEMISDNLHNTI